MNQTVRFSAFLLILLLSSIGAMAQLCTGSLGDPVVHITFGAGNNPGPALDNNGYIFLSQDCPNDGQYTVRNNTSNCFFNSWHSLNADHTGDPGGYFMLVNASFQPGDFYRQQVSGLCGNTTYEFAAWVVNVLKQSSCANNGIKPNLTFSIETVGGTVLASYNTEDIPQGNQPEWKQYGMFFTTPQGTSEVVVRIRNNAPGGCGNDLALDDITFRPCGARLEARIEGAPTGAVALCAGDTTTFQFTASVNSTYINPDFQWQQSADGGTTWEPITGATSTEYRWTRRPAGNYLYRLLIAEGGNIGSPSCRIASLPLKVQVHPKTEVQISDLLPLCPDVPLNLKASIKFLGNGTTQWELPAGATIGFQQQDSSGVLLISGDAATAAGNEGRYILSAVSEAGCTGGDTSLVQVLPKPTATIQMPAIACTDSEVTLLGNGTIAGGTISGWQWVFGAATASTQQVKMQVAADATSIPMQLTVQASNGCFSDPATATLPVSPKPVASFQMPEVCLTDPFAQFQNTSSISSGENLRYAWNFGDPQNAAAGSTAKDPQYRYGRSGIYPVRLQVTSASGCVADTVQQFTVNGAAPKAAFSVVGNLLCSADSVRIKNEATVDFGNITKLVIRWNGSNNAATTTDDNPTPGKEYTFNYAPFMDAPVKKFAVVYTVYSGIGCVNEIEGEIEVRKSPDAAMAAVLPVCEQDPAFQINAGSETTGASGTGTYNGNGILPDGFFNPVNAGAGEHIIRYRFEGANGCTDVATGSIRVLPSPLISAGPDRTLVAGGAIKLLGESDGTSARLEWTPAEGLDDPAALQPLARVATDRLFQLSATSAAGCTATDEVLVTIVPDLYVPNAFTPNGDGLNDTWQVPYLESVAGGDLKVFNRYGQVIFQTNGSRKWDGRLNGALLPNGAYVYLLRYNGQIKKGVVLLLR